MVNGDRTSGVLGGTGDPGQSGSQLRVPIHHLALSDHDHDLTAAMVFHIGDERLVRQRSNSRGMDSGRMNRRRNRRLRRSDPRHQPRSERGTDRDRTQRAMLQEPTARLISHGILQFQEQTGSSGNVRKRSHSTFRRRLTITHTKVSVRLAQPAKQYAATTNIRTTSTQIVTESNTCRPILLAIDVSRSAHTGFKTSCNEHLDPQINCPQTRQSVFLLPHQ